jgi:DNA-binding LacI/PurR family transcriptional regulator
MKTSGHLYEKQKNKIITDFQRHGFMTLVIDLGKFIESNMKDQDAMLDELIERQVDILVVDGDSAFPFPLLESKLDKLPLLAFINRYECVNYIDSIRVLPDFEKGSYLATKHLFDIGRKKILFHINDPVHIKDKACYSRTIHAGMMAHRRTSIF